MGKATQSQTEPYEVFRISSVSYEQCTSICILYIFLNTTIQLCLNTMLFNKLIFCRNSKGIQFDPRDDQQKTTISLADPHCYDRKT